MSSVSRRRGRYGRVLLKLSGACFANEKLLTQTVNQIVQAVESGTEIAVVVGGGNILRGRNTEERQANRRECGRGAKPRNHQSRILMDRVLADQSGMLATCINGNRLSAALTPGIAARHLCSVQIPGFIEHYSVRLARETLTRNKVLILSGGTGNPFFSTDSAAALRAAELKTEALLKATDVAGVFSADPKQNKAARLYRKLSYEQALLKKLGVMDTTAFALCMDRRIPIHVFDLSQPKAILDIIQGKETGSYIC